MTAGTKCVMRSYGPTHIRSKFSQYRKFLDEWGVGYSNTLRLFEIEYAETFSATMTRISIPTNTFDGSTTPIQVKIVSNSTDDTSDGTGARTCLLMGLDVLGYKEEIITMNGTNSVTSSISWKRIFHIYVTSVGSHTKNVGIITVTNLAASTVYLTIGADLIDSDGADLWYPQGWHVLLRRIILCPTNQTSNARSVAVRINREYFDEEVPNPIRNHYFKASGEGSSTFESALSEIHVADEGAHSIFYESYLGGEMAGKLKIVIMMYNPDPIARGLNTHTPYS